MRLVLMAPFSCRLQLRRLGRDSQDDQGATRVSHVGARNHHAFDPVVSSHQWLLREISICLDVAHFSDLTMSEDYTSRNSSFYHKGCPVLLPLTSDPDMSTTDSVDFRSPVS